MVFCWPISASGNGSVPLAYHPPHSSTTSLVRWRGSLSAITAQCAAISDSISSALSACRLKVSRVRPASTASRMVFCWPMSASGNGSVPEACQAPHSSTTSLVRWRGSLSAITAQLGGDQRFHLVGFAEDVVILLGVELHGVALTCEPVVGAPSAGIPGVVVHGPTPQASQRVGLTELAEETPRPVHIAIVGTRSDERGAHAVGRDPCRVAIELGAVVLGVEIAAAAPGLVAHAPVAHAQRIWLAVGRAQSR